MRVGDLIEDHQRAAVSLAGTQDVAEIGVLQRLDLEHDPLVRRVGRDKPAEVGGVAVLDS